MGAEGERSEALRWLLQPPGPGEIHFYVDVGQDTTLTPEVRQALNDLLRTMEGQDVAGFRLRVSDSCTGYYSGPCFSLAACPDYTQDPCAAYHCQPLTCRVCSGLTGIRMR
jgi:hypothetical protein